MGKPLRVLLIEDSDDDAQLLLRELRRSGYEVEFERVETAEAMQVVITEKTWDLILSDYTMPTFSALGALDVLKASGLDVPFIIVSGTIGEETAVAALKAGANDYLSKGNFAQLKPVIEQELHEAEIRRERRQAEEQIRAHAARLKVLADASQTFATTVHDYQGMLEMVAHQTAEAMGGFCGVRLLSEDGEWLEMVAMHDVDSEALELTRRLSNQPLRADEPNFVQRVLQSQQALLMPGVSEDQLRAIVKPEDWVHLKYIASHSRLLAPIRTRSEALGLLIISRRVGSPAFDEHDLSLAQDLADRAALAISNARLFKQVQNELTERKQAEEALRAKNEEIKAMSQQLWQAAKLATMGELAASIAHELNNPLATISLRTEMLMVQLSPDNPQSKSLKVIDAELKRMSTLVANLLEFSRRSSSQISTIDLREEVANTLELIRYHLRKYKILMVQDFSPETPLIQVDRQQLRQVFLNLFTNAADAMPKGGTLTIRTWPVEKSALGLTAPLRLPATASLGLPVSKLPQVLIEVSDTGEGIPPDKLERVWEPFYTTKPEGKGTGLGLAICRRIVQEHGGTIEIISDRIPGKGTTVRITLPAVKGK